DGPLTRKRMASNFRVAEKAGLQPAVHAIGDEANHILLNLYDEIEAQNGKRDRRPRVEHAQHLMPDDISRFGSLGAIASMQPYHKADDGRYAESVIGPSRCRTSYAFRQLLDSGGRLAFGSDWPVVTMNPFEGMRVAVTGRTLDGQTWMTHQNITAEQALAAYTIGGANACRMDDRLGRTSPGCFAEFVVFDSDPLPIAADHL